MKRFLAVLLMVGAASLMTAGPAVAHKQTVSPPGQETSILDGPIARAWIQGHCQAQAPYVTFEASDGVVQFFYDGVPDCTGILNPGGMDPAP